jgi:hypothetical protein
MLGHLNIIADENIILMSEVGDSKLVQNRKHVPPHTRKPHSRLGGNQ